ncbi:MAG: hypothetical protein ACRDUS_08250 [Mycobacterium sp.]
MRPLALFWIMVGAACVLIGLDAMIYMASPHSGGSAGALAALMMFNLILFVGLGIYLRRRR